MVERRGMGQALALTPEKMAFIQGGAETVEPPAAPLHQADAKNAIGRQARQPRIAPQSVASDETSASPPRPRRSRASADLRTNVADLGESDGFYGPLLVPLTTRLQPKTADALRRACLEQKLARRTPNTQQEIVELAVAQWLKEHRFL
jgi:hypothetical protein